MAVTNAAEAELLNRFWPRYKRVTMFRALSLQLLVCLIVIAIILVLYPNPPLDAWIVMIIVSVMSLVLTLIVTTLTMRPLKDLSSALVHVSGEPTAQTPPNLNDSYYVRSKLRPLLKLVYDMATHQSSAPTQPNEPAMAPAIDLAAQLNHTATGLVMLNGAGEVIFSNKSAPVTIDANGKKSLDLIFDVDQPIAEWLAERGNHDIHAEKAWLRIANKLMRKEPSERYQIAEEICDELMEDTD